MTDLIFEMPSRAFRGRGLLWGLIAGIFLSISACGGESASSSYQQSVMQDRVQRDMRMREKESVLAPNLRSSFKGLDYFAVDTTYHFVVPLHRQVAPDTVMLAENTGRIREQVQIGTITVPLPHGDERLLVFQGEGDDPRGRLWVPFADATNGDSTYEAGRYVDLERADADSVVVDFNRAYNPTCVYNPGYACPLPPSENRLDVPVPAGEKTPQFAKN